MVRTPKKRLGSRAYANYAPEKLQECIEKIKSREMTQREASATYGIPRSTIKNKLKGAHPNKSGRARIFTDEEEKSFEDHLIKLSDYGFPLVELDFRVSVKSYLDRKGVVVPQFKQNFPGYEWTKSFLKRHENLSFRVSKNIKKVRAEVNAEVIENYMDNLKDVLQGIPATHVWNYDETNLSDDPGNRKVICKRGTKYVENICNSTKASTSLMICGSASGDIIPPYVVYRAENIWTTWTENGPDGARYNRSKNGWFDTLCFEDWFESHFLRYARKLTGPIVLIGDNLSSHISKHVLELCETHNVRFVCLPPNSTHITQPLDVAFFGPTKRVWREILKKWKESASGSKYASIPKYVFPTLLKELMNNLDENKRSNLIAGFEKCGIHPLNKQKLLDRLPENQNVDYDSIGDSFLEQLEKKRAEYLQTDGPKRKNKKIQVPAGKSITVEDLQEEAYQQPSASGVTARKTKTQSQKRQTQKGKMEIKSRKQSNKIFYSSSSEDEDDVLLESDEVSETFSDLEDSILDHVVPPLNSSVSVNPLEFAVDNFVVVNYNGEKYPGRIVSISSSGPIVECMEKKLKFWRWPEKKDTFSYDWEDVYCKIKPPKMVSKRNQFIVPEIDVFFT